jgi:hypothetical protein
MKISSRRAREPRGKENGWTEAHPGRTRHVQAGRNVILSPAGGNGPPRVGGTWLQRRAQALGC